jgi:hypothetical protein
LGVELARLAEIGQRLRNSPGVEFREAAMEIGVVVLGIVLDGGVVVDDDLVQIALGLILGVTVAGGNGILAVEPDGLDPGALGLALGVERAGVVLTIALLGSERGARGRRRKQDSRNHRRGKAHRRHPFWPAPSFWPECRNAREHVGDEAQVKSRDTAR